MTETEMEKCAIYNREGDRCTITCRLGLWAVDGPYGLATMNEAGHYFEQCKRDGEYDELLNQ